MPNTRCGQTRINNAAQPDTALPTVVENQKEPSI